MSESKCNNSFFGKIFCGIGGFFKTLCKCDSKGGCCASKKDEAVAEKPAGHCGCGHQH